MNIKLAINRFLTKTFVIPYRKVKRAILKTIDTLILRPYKFLKGLFLKFFWNPLVKVCKFISWKISFFFWRVFPSRGSIAEAEKYRIFINSLGGWSNVSAFTCKAKSWHLKLTHSFLVNWNDLKLFNISIISWSWPYLDLSLGPYSKWMFKRLKLFTSMPKLRKVKR